MLNLLLIIELGLLIISYYISGKKLTSPSCLVNFSFFFSSALLCAYSSKWGLSLHANTIIVICGGNITFMIGEILSYLNGRPKRVLNDSLSKSENNIYIKSPFSLFMALIMGLSCLLVYRYIASHTSIYINQSGVASTLLGSYRHFSGEVTTTWMIALMTIGKIVMYLYAYIILYSLFISKEKVKIMELTVLLFSIVLCALSSARVDIIFLACSIILWMYGMFECSSKSYYETSNKIIKYGVIIGIAMFATFLFLGNFTGKAGKTFSESMDIIVIYAGSGILGLDEYLQSFIGPHFSGGSETLYGISSLMNKLGLEGLTKYRHLEFFRIGNSKYTSNIYTVYRRLLHDYGFFFTMFIRALEGLFFGKLYKKMYSSYNPDIFFGRLLVFGSIIGILITESVDTFFLMILPTLTEVIMIIFFKSFYNTIMCKRIRFDGVRLFIDRQR